MKFLDPSIHGSKVTAGIKRSDAHTHVHTYGQAKSNLPYQLYQSWEHKKRKILLCQGK